MDDFCSFFSFQSVSFSPHIRFFSLTLPLLEPSYSMDEHFTLHVFLVFSHTFLPVFFFFLLFHPVDNNREQKCFSVLFFFFFQLPFPLSDLICFRFSIFSVPFQSVYNLILIHFQTASSQVKGSQLFPIPGESTNLHPKQVLEQEIFLFFLIFPVKK